MAVVTIVTTDYPFLKRSMFKRHPDADALLIRIKVCLYETTHIDAAICCRPTPCCLDPSNPMLL